MKKITGIFFAGIITSISVFTINATSTIGFNLTGAPGEGSCASCHLSDHNPDQIGSIKILINGVENLSTFIPDSIYEFEVTSTYPGLEKYGFALNARYPGLEFQNAGTFLEAGDSGVVVSDYVTHNLRGSNGQNIKTWRFKWQAPSSPQNEKITFYAAAVMGNNDQSTQGDKVFLNTYTLKNALSSISKLNVTPSIQFLQNGNGATIVTDLHLLKITIQNIEGKNIPFTQETLHNGSSILFRFDPTHSLYLVSVQTEKGTYTKKIWY